MKNKDVILKIKKLLALSESSNVNESRLAMLKAQKLLIKHKLTIEEVNDKQSNEGKIVKEVTNVTFTKAKWKGILAQLIAKNFYCHNYYFRSKTNRVIFVGNKEDVYICRLVYEYAIECIASNVKERQNIYRKEGKSIKGLEMDYALGFIRGLKISFDKQKEKNLGLELTIIKDKNLEDLDSSIKTKGTINMNSKLTGFYSEFRKGFKDGENFNIYNKIEDGKDENAFITS